jgi:superfamily II DNA/RNA helicase
MTGHPLSVTKDKSLPARTPRAGSGTPSTARTSGARTSGARTSGARTSTARTSSGGGTPRAGASTSRRRVAQQTSAGGRPDWSPRAPKKPAAAQPLPQPARKAQRDQRLDRIGATSRPAATAGEAVAPTGAPSFASLGVTRALVKALSERGITSPFPIQAATLPDSLAGRDVIGRGRTGSGKTIAFAIPTVTVLSRSKVPLNKNRPRALILVPTRELAAQVAETFTPLAEAFGLTTAVVVGGVAYNRQIATLSAGVDVLIATPGRLEDLIAQRKCRLDAVEVTVLDEADMMADMGFLPPVQRLLDATPSGQRLLFSATIDRAVDGLVRRYLSEPVTHVLETTDEQAAETEHHVLAVPRDQKHAVVQQLAGGQGRSLLFTRTKYGAAKLAANLTAAGIPAVELHGDLVHKVRARNLEAFTNGVVRVLVATDIAARGIHVDDVSLVVHVDPPAEHKAYVHRSGRTARAGASGTVVTIVLPDQRREVASLMRTAGIRAVETPVAAGAREIRELVGPPAEYVDPEYAAILLAPEPAKARSGRSGGPGGAAAQPRRTARSSGRTGGGATRADGGLGARPRRSR